MSAKQSRSSVYGAGAGDSSRSRPTSPRWTMMQTHDEDTAGPDSFPFIPTYDAAPTAVAPGRSTIPSSSSYVSRSRAASPAPSSSSPAKSRLSKQRPPSLAPSSLSSSPSATYAYAPSRVAGSGGGGGARAPTMSSKLTKSRGNTSSSVSSSLAAKLISAPRSAARHHKLRSSGSTAEHLNSEEIAHMIDPAYYSASSPGPAAARAGPPSPYPYSPSPYSPSVYSASASRRRFSGGGNDYDDDDDDLQESDEDEYADTTTNRNSYSYTNNRNSYNSYATTTPTSAHGHGHTGPDLSRPYTDAEGRLHDPAFRLFDVEIAPHVREKRAQQRSASANSTAFSSYTRAASPSLYAHSIAPSYATKQKSKLQYGAVAQQQQLSPPSDHSSAAMRPASYDPLLGTSTMRSLDADEYEDAEDGYAQGDSPEYASALDHAASHSHVGVIGPSPVSPTPESAVGVEHEARTDSGYGASPASPAGPVGSAVRSSIGMVTTDSSSGGVKGSSTTTTTGGMMITAAESSMHTSMNADASSPSAAADVDQAQQHVNPQQHHEEHSTPQLQKRILSIHLDAPTPHTLTPPGSGPGTRPGTPGRSGTAGSSHTVTTLPYRPHPVRELSRSTLYPRPVADGSNTAFGVGGGFHSNPHSRMPSAPSLLIPNSPQARSVSSSSLSSSGGDEGAKRKRRRRKRDALSMMPEGYYSDEDEDNPFKPVVVPAPPQHHHHGHAHTHGGSSSHGHGHGAKTLVPGLHAPTSAKTKVAAKVKAKKNEIFHSGHGAGDAEKSTSSGAGTHAVHSSHPTRGRGQPLSRAVSTISGDEGAAGEKRTSRPTHGGRSRSQQHLHQGQRATTPSRELSLGRESSAGAAGGRLGYVPSHHGKSVSLRPGVQVIEDDYAPGCTDGLRRSWQSFKLSLRFGAFRTRKRIERKVAAIKG